jgi:hypothetical protein
MKRQWTGDELADHWTLGPTEHALLANKSDATRLGFAVLLKAFTLEGRFPRQKHDVLGIVIVHVANQVNLPADLDPAARSSEQRCSQSARMPDAEPAGSRRVGVRHGTR